MRDYFCGWYIKCQNETQTLALIPAYHMTKGKKSCSIQMITNERAWNVPFDYALYHRDADGVTIGKSWFTRQGVDLNLHGPGLDAAGTLRFSPFDTIGYDIMGPFQYVPFMQCRHSVFSMGHSVSGRITVNGREFIFDNGVCYMEGDRGHSFPREYVWTQCCFPGGSLMLSVADIPFCGCHFTGVICIIHYQGREYRLGTYLGARAVKIRDGEVVIRQGSKQLKVQRLEQQGHPLAAPIAGKMTRSIRESTACRAYYQLLEKGKTIFEFNSDRASFEYEYPQ